MRYRAYVVAVMSLAVSGCQAPAPRATSQGNDEAAIRSAVEQYLRGMLPPGDPSAMARPFADSAQYLAAGEPTFKGKAAIEGFFKAYVDAFVLGPTTYQIHDIRISGDLAAVVVSATEEFTDRATGQSLKDDFKGMSVLTRQPDGSWKIVYHMYNSDHPAPLAVGGSTPK